MRTHIQIPEIHPANVGGRSKQGALKCPIVPGFVPICRPVFTNPVHLDVKPACRTSDGETSYGLALKFVHDKGRSHQQSEFLLKGDGIPGLLKSSPCENYKPIRRDHDAGRSLEAMHRWSGSIDTSAIPCNDGVDPVVIYIAVRS